MSQYVGFSRKVLAIALIKHSLGWLSSTHQEAAEKLRVELLNEG